MLSEGQCIYQGTIGNIIPYLQANELECPIYHNPVEYGNWLTNVLWNKGKHLEMAIGISYIIDFTAFLNAFSIL